MSQHSHTPLAVLDLDWKRLPNSVDGLEKYGGALILIRFDGRPVGQALLPVENGRLGGRDLRHALLCAADSAFWQAWLAEFLEFEQALPEIGLPQSATVAVCTRDRPEDMQRCLTALASLHDHEHEILVIDNAPSNDDTRRIVEQFSAVRYVREERPGLDFARNRALQEARYPLVAFTDDDAAPDPNWLQALIRNFGDPRVACATGLTMPVELETRAQVAFQRAGGLGRGFKRIVYDQQNLHPLEAWKAGAGVNMALRKDMVFQIGGFDECLDVGTPVAGGGDSDIYRRLLKAGHRLVYDPEALVWHRHRESWEALRRQVRGYESAGFALLWRSFLYEGDVSGLRSAQDWISREIPEVAAATLGLRGKSNRDLSLQRLRGALTGPWAYLRARSNHRAISRGQG